MDSRREEFRDDIPTYSKLFIVCDRSLNENDFKEAFSKFGTIEYTRIPRDPTTGAPKGIVFIKFSKASEAAAAIEGMNFKRLPNTDRCLKMFVACNRSHIQTDDNTDKYKRLFVNVPKQLTENELREIFNQYGRVESVLIQREGDTNKSKGFAYITFRTFLEAALALERCDSSYRCIFAQPRINRRCETAFVSNISTLATSTVNDTTALISNINVKPRGFTSILFMCSPHLTQEHVAQLFDIVPGMVNCKYYIDLLGNHGKGMVQYSNPASAAHAVDKLNEFEYPPGSKIFVKPDDNYKSDYSGNDFNKIPDAVKSLRSAIAASRNIPAPNLAHLAEAIAEASKLIKMATTDVSNYPDPESLHYCSVKLPQRQPLLDIDSPVAKRCFLVCKPEPPPLTVLRDVFCRFGNLIDVYALPNKTIGYARYATAESADEAIKILHGAEICGVRMKVLTAEDEVPSKRTKYHRQLT